jgi:hypothetical protein
MPKKVVKPPVLSKRRSLALLGCTPLLSRIIRDDRARLSLWTRILRSEVRQLNSGVKFHAPAIGRF